MELYCNPAGPPWCLVRKIVPADEPMGTEVKEGVVPSGILSSFPKAHGIISPALSDPANAPGSVNHQQHQRPSSEGQWSVRGEGIYGVT